MGNEGDWGREPVAPDPQQTAAPSPPDAPSAPADTNGMISGPSADGHLFCLERLAQMQGTKKALVRVILGAAGVAGFAVAIPPLFGMTAVADPQDHPSFAASGLTAVVLVLLFVVASVGHHFRHCRTGDQTVVGLQRALGAAAIPLMVAVPCSVYFLAKPNELTFILAPLGTLAAMWSLIVHVGAEHRRHHQPTTPAAARTAEDLAPLVAAVGVFFLVIGVGKPLATDSNISLSSGRSATAGSHGVDDEDPAATTTTVAPTTTTTSTPPPPPSTTTPTTTGIVCDSWPGEGIESNPSADAANQSAVADHMRDASYHSSASAEEWGCLDGPAKHEGDCWSQTFEQSDAVLVGTDYLAGVGSGRYLQAYEDTKTPLCSTEPPFVIADRIDFPDRTRDVQASVEPSGLVRDVFGRKNKTRKPIRVSPRLLPAYHAASEEAGVALVPVAEAVEGLDGVVEQDTEGNDGRIVTIREAKGPRTLTLGRLYQLTTGETEIPPAFTVTVR